MRTNNPKVSVIIPTKNRIEYLDRAVESVLNQTESQIEIIVVDDGSDPPVKNKYRDKRVKIVRNKGTHGPANARNKGLETAKGKYIAFLDSDDYWHPLFLKSCIRVLDSNPDLSGVLTLSHKVYTPNFPFLAKFKLTILNILKDILTIWIYVTNKKRLVPTALFLCQISHLLFYKKRINPTGFDPNFKFCEDWIFILNAVRKQPIQIIPSKHVYFNYSHDSNTFTIIKKIHTNKSHFYELLFQKISSRYKKDFYLNIFKFYYQNFLVKSLN